MWSRYGERPGDDERTVASSGARAPDPLLTGGRDQAEDTLTTAQQAPTEMSCTAHGCGVANPANLNPVPLLIGAGVGLAAVSCLVGLCEALGVGAAVTGAVDAASIAIGSLPAALGYASAGYLALAGAIGAGASLLAQVGVNLASHKQWNSDISLGDIGISAVGAVLTGGLSGAPILLRAGLGAATAIAAANVSTRLTEPTPRDTLTTGLTGGAAAIPDFGDSLGGQLASGGVGAAASILARLFFP